GCAKEESLREHPRAAHVEDQPGERERLHGRKFYRSEMTSPDLTPPNPREQAVHERSWRASRLALALARTAEQAGSGTGGELLGLVDEREDERCRGRQLAPA